MDRYFQKLAKVFSIIALIIVVFLMVTGQLALSFVPLGIALLADLCLRMSRGSKK